MDVNKKSFTTNLSTEIFIAVEVILGIALVASASSVAVLAIKWLASVIR